MFVIEELEWTRCIETRPNPDSTPEKPLPDLATGEESYNLRKVEPIAILSGDGTLSQDPDGYKEFRVEFRAQDAGFSRSLEQAPFEEYLGFPPEAAKSKSAYELREEAPPKDAEEPQPDPVTTGDFYIRSADYSGAPKGSLSFQGVRTRAEFEQAARTNLLEKQFDDISETVVLATPNLEIRPGDLFVYIHNGTQRKRRVIEVANKIMVQGMSASRRIVTGSTQLKLGINSSTDVLISGSSGLSAPSNDPPPVIDLFFAYYPGRTLGEIQRIPDSQFRY
jgi:hypothetical protein